MELGHSKEKQEEAYTDLHKYINFIYFLLCVTFIEEDFIVLKNLQKKLKNVLVIYS